MSATNDVDRRRLALDDSLACLVQADRRLRSALVLLVQSPQAERETVEHTLAARRYVDEARRTIAALHPNGRECPPVDTP